MQRCRTAVGTASTRLFVVRGNSGSGKSTLAAAVRDSRPPGEVAVIGQDLVRASILGTGSDAGGHASSLIDLSARYLLGEGLHVILEGVLHPEWYAGLLRELVADHVGRSFLYVYDLTFDETLRRHNMKPNSDAFGELEMRQWWRDIAPVDGLDEKTLGPEASLANNLYRLTRDSWPEDCAESP